MKKVLQWGAFACALAIGQYGYAQEEEGNWGGYAGGGGYEGGEVGGGPGGSYNPDMGYTETARPPCDTPTGDCWCLYKHEEPCYYNCWRCVEDKKYCKKKCCRYVPQSYCVQHCRYVPKYETETRCRYVPEYYYVNECLPCKRWVCDRKCRYNTRYYYKRECRPVCEQPQTCCPEPVQQNSCCR